MSSAAEKHRRGRPKNEDRAALMTQAEVAVVLGVSRARVMQIEQRALAKLRYGLRDYR